MATDKTPSSKHGRLHEEEAKREETERKPISFGFKGKLEPEPAKPVYYAKPFSDADTEQQKAARVERAKPAPKAKPDISARMDALRSALSDKYPHNDVEVTPEGLKVAVPTGHITIESEKVSACADNAELRAYIDALPIQ